MVWVHDPPPPPAAVEYPTIFVTPARCGVRNLDFTTRQRAFNDYYQCVIYNNSGLMTGALVSAEDILITLCKFQSKYTGTIKTVKYLERVASTMLAVTNLAICINLALIVSVSTVLYVTAVDYTYVCFSLC